MLQKGKMKQQASHLSTEEKETIAKYIAQSAIVKSDSGSTNNCSKVLEKTDLEQSSSWPSWGYDNFNTRNQRFSSINTNNIKNLKLRWSFGIGSQGRSDWIRFSELLEQIGKKAFEAAENKDPEELFEVGADLYQACVACHNVYMKK